MNHTIVGRQVDESDGWIVAGMSYSPLPAPGTISALSLVLVVNSCACRNILIAGRARQFRLTWSWYRGRILGVFDGDSLPLMVDAIKAIDRATFGPYDGPLGVTINPGDTVTTNIEGPRMYVKDVCRRSGDNCFVANCIWLNDDGLFESFDFPLACLVRVPHSHDRGRP